LKAVGIARIRDLEFMDQPPNDIIDCCLKILAEIKCINDHDEQITDYGK
jgi:HrpA-like RNA helicase